MQRDEVHEALAGYQNELEAMLRRFKKDRDGVYMADGDEGRFRELVLELRDLFDDAFADSARHSRPLMAYFQESITNWIGSPSYRGVENVKGVVASALMRLGRNPLALKAAASAAKAKGVKDPDFVLTLAERLHGVVRQLRARREDRPTLDVTDEYDVQDLFHALLSIHFDDVRKEEWAPSYAGAGSRMDFLLPEIEAVVETKMTRRGLEAKQLGEQLIIDIEKYKKHPACRTLFCVVYDPDGRITNPRGLENDLAQETDKLAVRVMIVPK